MTTPQPNPPDKFADFDLPNRSACIEELSKRFPPEYLAELVAKLPAKSRAKLERRFGPILATQKPK